MLDILLGVGVALSLGIGGYGIAMAVGIRKTLSESETMMRLLSENNDALDHKVTDLQSILTAAPRDMIDASVIATEWKAAMQALPEGSPKRQAYEARLKQLGVS
jgi:hypothetical protein